MVRFFKFKAKISLKQRLYFAGKKALQLWSEFQQIQAKKPLKKWLDFSDKRIQSKINCNNGWISQIKKGLQLWSDLLKIFETTVGFFKEKWIATMVKFPSKSS